jgi:hypothetical protein
MSDHGWRCDEPECGAGGVNDFTRSAFSDAEWHNTMTGHDVTVILDQGAEEWRQGGENGEWGRTYRAPRAV